MMVLLMSARDDAGTGRARSIRALFPQVLMASVMAVRGVQLYIWWRDFWLLSSNRFHGRLRL